MTKKAKHNPIKLDPEEQEILSSYENGEWTPVTNSEEEKKFARETANRTLIKQLFSYLGKY